MSDRSEALEQVVALARRHGLSVAEITAALGGPTGDVAGDGPGRRVLVRVLGYLGGTFVFAGIGVFVALQWDNINSLGRVVVTLGSGLAAFILALLAAREERFEKAAIPLLLIAAALEPTGMFVAFKEFGSGGDWRWASLVTMGAMAVQFGAAFGALRRSTPLLLTVLFATLFCWTAFDLLDLADEGIALCLGGSLLLTAVGLDRTRHREITPILYFFGSVAFLYGLFDIVEHTVFEIAFLGVAAAFVYLAAGVRSRVLLFVATIAILAYTGYYTDEHFADSIGWPLALIAFGIVMIGLSALAFRIDREYVRRAG
jgi:Predicted membrane protein (DUF2157)